MDPTKMAEAIATAAWEKKAYELKALDMEGLVDYTDCFVICSARSSRQLAAIADIIVERMREQGKRPLHVEGKSEGQWVLIDYGDVVVHIFLDSLRGYYDLEGLWHEARVLPLDEPDFNMDLYADSLGT